VAGMGPPSAADCRLSAYRVAMKLVANGLDAGQDRHRAGIDAARAARRKRVADAALRPA
jgi:hypothetical protein